MSLKYMRYNRYVLEDLVRAGGLKNVGAFYEYWWFEGPGGYIYKYYTKIGLVKREDGFGNYYIFGNKWSSRHKTGYLCVEMIIPYDADEHKDVSEENMMYDRDGNLLGVQYTCYVHQIASIVADCLRLNGDTSGSIANHKDNCPLHNWLSNIETVTGTLNNYHAAVVTSIKVNAAHLPFKQGSTRNKKYEFSFTNEISAYDVEAYMNECLEFKKAVIECSRTLRYKKLKNKYISVGLLLDFYKYLKSNDKI